MLVTVGVTVDSGNSVVTGLGADVANNRGRLTRSPTIAHGDTMSFGAMESRPIITRARVPVAAKGVTEEATAQNIPLEIINVVPSSSVADNAGVSVRSTTSDIAWFAPGSRG